MALKLPIVSKFDPKGVNDARRGFQDLTNAASVASGIIIGAFAGIAIGVGKISIDSVKIASGYQEVASAIKQSFGESAQSLIDFAKTAPDLLGMTQTQFLDASKQFGLFGQAAGIAGEDNVEFSKGLSILAADLASFNNTSVDDAIGALGAALRGENEPIRRYGVLLDDATLKAKAMEMGIYDGTDALTPQQKVLAAHAAILEQTTIQQGDFARTQDGMAGSVKTLQANFEDLQLKLGEQLLPVFDRLIDQFTDFIDNNGPQLEVAIKAVADMVIGLVESFIGFTTWYTENQGLANSIAGALAIVGGAFVVATGIIWAFNAALYANPIGIIVAAILIGVALIVAAIVVIAENWDEITRFMGKAWDAVVFGIGTAWAAVANGVINGINFVIKAFNGLLDVWNTIAGTDFSIDLISNVTGPSIPSSLQSGARTTFGREYGGQGFKLAAGGIVMPRPGGTLATIGEAGQAEAVIPLDRLDRMMGSRGGGATYVVNVNGGLSTSSDVGRAVVEAIKRYERTSGPVFASA
jgi:hypothetical protein